MQSAMKWMHDKEMKKTKSTSLSTFQHGEGMITTRFQITLSRKVSVK